MNDLGMAEYLLKEYARIKVANADDDFQAGVELGQRRLIEQILLNRFGLRLEATDSELKAYNSYTSVSIRR